MKSKHHMAEEVWSMALIVVITIFFLYMVFAWVVSLVLSVAVSKWFLLMIPMWFADAWALDRITKYARRKWGA